MIKFNVMYPGQPGARFDHTYYRDKHMPLVKRLMGDKCLYYTVDKGIGGGAPGESGAPRRNRRRQALGEPAPQSCC